MSKSQLNQLALVFITILWGLGFVVTKDSLEHVGPITFSSWRFLAATLLIIPFWLYRGIDAAFFRATKGGIVMGMLLAAGYVTQTIGLKTSTNGKVAFITGLYVVITPLLAWLILKKRPKFFPVLGTIVAGFGLGFLSFDKNWQISQGDLWALACAGFFASHIIATNHFVEKHSPTLLSTQQIVVTALVTTIFSYLLEQPHYSEIKQIWWPVTFTGVFCSVLALYLFTKAQQVVSPTMAGLILILESVFGAFFGWWLAGEHFGTKEFIGCGLILVALVLAQLPEK